MLIKFSAYSVYTSEREAGKKKFSLYLGSAWQAVKAERVFKTLVTLFLRLKTLQSKRKKNIQGSFSVQKKSFDSNGFLSEEQDSQTPNAIFQQ